MLFGKKYFDSCKDKQKAEKYANKVKSETFDALTRGYGMQGLNYRDARRVAETVARTAKKEMVETFEKERRNAERRETASLIAAGII